uniref:Uncharacterized protein n=1 Tax=Rhizophora mucronata TaxID=61149 RepID=A0A2P2N161_RHIMU
MILCQKEIESDPLNRKNFRMCLQN